MKKSKKQTIFDKTFDITYNFSAAEEKQIASRFKAIYDILVTQKRWIKGALAASGDAIIADFTVQSDILENEEDHTIVSHPDAYSFCLVGAVRHINGPTEEEITRLLAAAVAIYKNFPTQVFDYVEGVNVDQELANDWVMLDFITEDHSLSSRLDQFMLFLAGDFTNEEFVTDIIVDFNDKKTTKPKDIEKVLKIAQGLYPLIKEYRAKNSAIWFEKEDLMNNIADKYNDLTVKGDKLFDEFYKKAKRVK